jgi:hypothetical protein
LVCFSFCFVTAAACKALSHPFFRYCPYTSCRTTPLHPVGGC